MMSCPHLTTLLLYRGELTSLWAGLVACLTRTQRFYDPSIGRLRDTLPF